MWKLQPNGRMVVHLRTRSCIQYLIRQGFRIESSSLRHEDDSISSFGIVKFSFVFNIFEALAKPKRSRTEVLEKG